MKQLLGYAPSLKRALQLFIGWLFIGAIFNVLFTQEQLFFAINSHYTSALNYIMYGFTLLGDGLSVLFICLIALLVSKKHQSTPFIINAITVNYIPGLVTQYIKHSFNYNRPLIAIKEVNKIHIESWWPVLHYNSFPSGHTTTAFSLATVLACYTQNKKVQIIYLALALAAGYSRIYLGQHYPSDVFMGAFVGTSSAIICNWASKQLMKRKKSKSFIVK